MDLLKQDIVVKGLSVGIVAFLIDKYYVGVEDLQTSVMFSLGIGSSMAIGTYLSSISPEFYDLGQIAGSDKTVDARIMEIGYGSLASFIINSKLLKNSFYTNPGYATLQLTIYDILGEYLKDYIQGNNISYLESDN